MASVVFEKDEHPTEPMFHVTAPLFSALKESPDKKLLPLSAVLLLHFINTQELEKVLIGGYKFNERISGSLLTENYKTAEP
ncbi:MAG: hypothetical protein DDT18_01529 [Actinobacteria bacterium]|nr:hypothetical protein [Actinomycetota bacterium]